MKRRHRLLRFLHPWIPTGSAVASYPWRDRPLAYASSATGEREKERPVLKLWLALYYKPRAFSLVEIVASLFARCIIQVSWWKGFFLTWYWHRFFKGFLSVMPSQIYTTLKLVFAFHRRTTSPHCGMHEDVSLGLRSLNLPSYRSYLRWTFFPCGPNVKLVFFFRSLLVSGRGVCFLESAPTLEVKVEGPRWSVWSWTTPPERLSRVEADEWVVEEDGNEKWVILCRGVYDDMAHAVCWAAIDFCKPHLLVVVSWKPATPAGVAALPSVAHVISPQQKKKGTIH